MSDQTENRPETRPRAGLTSTDALGIAAVAVFLGAMAIVTSLVTAAFAP